MVWSSFEALFQDSLAKIKDCRKAIELEVAAANAETSASRHEELKTLLRAQAAPGPAHTLHLPCHSIMFPRNHNFRGRRDSLEYLKQRLVNGSPARQHSLALTGLGGVGKTQLAMEFVWKYSVHFQAILWVHADSALKLEQGYTMFAQKLGLIPINNNAGDVSCVIKQVNTWFEETRQLPLHFCQEIILKTSRYSLACSVR